MRGRRMLLDGRTSGTIAGSFAGVAPAGKCAWYLTRPESNTLRGMSLAMPSAGNQVSRRAMCGTDRARVREDAQHQPKTRTEPRS